MSKFQNLRSNCEGIGDKNYRKKNVGKFVGGVAF